MDFYICAFKNLQFLKRQNWQVVVINTTCFLNVKMIHLRGKHQPKYFLDTYKVKGSSHANSPPHQLLLFLLNTET